MKIHLVETGLFKLDGGAMFGIVPRRLWQKLNPPDENNMCTWAMRCLLVKYGDRRILFDTGIGDKQDEKFRRHFEPHGETTLLGSLSELGLQPEDITDVFLTHLHFDHVGGSVSRLKDGTLVPTFPHATYWSNELHYEWAYRPNMREKASFLKENFVPLHEAGVLKFLPLRDNELEWLPGIDVRYVYGHTEAMMVPTFTIGDKKIVYCADVIPSSFHIGLPYVMSYDIRPLVTLSEKEKILTEALEENRLLIFEHDPRNAGCTVKRNERGRIVVDEVMSIESFLQE